jgi:hypothetical protein
MGFYRLLARQQPLRPLRCFEPLRQVPFFLIFTLTRAISRSSFNPEAEA